MHSERKTVTVRVLQKRVWVCGGRGCDSVCAEGGGGKSILIYNRLSLSRSPRNSLKYFEIIMPRHISLVKKRKTKSNINILQMSK